MTAHHTDLPPLDIVTEHGTVTCLPTSFPLRDPERDADLDPDVFQQGFEDSIADLDRLPHPWARNFASMTLDQALDPTSDRSYVRGYRAGLYGFLQHSCQ
ncbi:hypothetical protein [Gordonia sp. (in: high G+C Gram-positive bacteria)]|uniref:hypothetical protein n=1 Tax=Gordonia sp. (in: high G+C Gram-positive bacteria) TaxID=84139 RepID=UPI003C759F39